MYTDKSPKNFSLLGRHELHALRPVAPGRCQQLSNGFGGAALVGMGSSVFHPESSRIARLASGGRHGFAQSLFQVGGNVGSAIGPLGGR